MAMRLGLKARPRLSEGCKIEPFDTSSFADEYLVTLASGVRLKMSDQLYRIVREVDGSRCVAEIAEAVTEGGIDVSAEEIAEVLAQHLIPSGIVACERFGEEKAAVSTTRKPKSSLTLRLPLVSYERLAPVTSRLAFLFRRKTAVAACAVAVLATIAFYLFYAPSGITNLARQATGAQAAVFLVLILASVCIHELGHAAAAKANGIRHGPVGVGLYLVFPVFFVNLDEAWSLPRRARAVVDAAGVYFQALYCVPLVIATPLTRAPILAVAVVVVHTTMLYNLHPFLKFDGYWLFSDLSGVPNLHKQAREWLKSLVTRKRISMELPKLERALLGGYAITTGAFLVFFGYYIPRLLWNTPKMFVYAGRGFLDAWLAGDPGHILASLVAMAIPIVLIVALVLPIARFLLRAIIRARPARSEAFLAEGTQL
jgi:putative peptide zinc metalloprotease protein